MLISSLTFSASFMLSPSATLRPTSPRLLHSRYLKRATFVRSRFEIFGRRSTDIAEGNFESLADDDEDDYGTDGIKVNAIDKNE